VTNQIKANELPTSVVFIETKITAKVISNFALKFRKNAHFSPLKIA